MTAATRLSLIVNTFNQPVYLVRVLNAISRQTSPAHEVLLADDGSGEETRQVFAKWAAAHTFHAEHVWQKNEGFRRSRILNQAIARAQGDYLVFLDGDTVPHPRFITDHRRLARIGFFIQGHRALVQEQGARFFGLGAFTRDRRRALWQGQLSGWKNAYRWPRPLLRIRADPGGIRGCNLGIWHADLVGINGYNEAFVGWGREDSELAVRLMNSGVRRLDVRGWALCYHLWHPPANRAGLPANDDLLAQAQREGATRCEAGLDRHRPTLRILPSNNIINLPPNIECRTGRPAAFRLISDVRHPLVDVPSLPESGFTASRSLAAGIAPMVYLCDRIAFHASCALK